MINRKKMIAILSALSLTFSISACKNKNTVHYDEDGEEYTISKHISTPKYENIDYEYQLKVVDDYIKYYTEENKQIYKDSYLHNDEKLNYNSKLVTKLVETSNGDKIAVLNELNSIYIDNKQNINIYKKTIKNNFPICYKVYNNIDDFEQYYLNISTILNEKERLNPKVNTK